MKKIKYLSLGLALVLLTCSYRCSSNSCSPNGRKREHPECQRPIAPRPATADAPSVSAYNAPARIDIACGWDFFLTGDFIYWQAVEDGLAYAATTERDFVEASLTLPPNNGQLLNVDFGWHPGFKVGMGGTLSGDDYDLYVQWTHLASHNNTSSGSPDNGFLIPANNYPNRPLGCTDAFSSWRCIYDVGDFEIGRSFYLGKKWVMRMFGGVRGSYIRQTYNTQFDNVILSPETGNLVQAGTIHVSRCFESWGVGPRVGLDINWLLGWGWRIFEKNGISIQYTDPEGELKELAPGLQNRAEVSIKNSSSREALRPNVDFEAGFGWGSYFDDYRWHVDLSLAYEFHYWWNQNFDLFPIDDFNFTIEDASRGNLGLHGATFRVQFDF